MRHIDFPFRFDAQGRTASSDDAAYVRDLLELVVFTDPGERVNRPGFGGGVRSLIFAPNRPELEAALKFTIQANLRVLSSLLDVLDLGVESEESRLTITISYALRRTGAARTEILTRAL